MAAILFGLLILLSACGTANQTDLANIASADATAPLKETARVTEEEDMRKYDFSDFPNVTITGIDISSLNESELAVLYAQARYCQAMTDADIDTMRELVAEDIIYTHMSGMQQTREEYFADIAAGALRYFTIGIVDPVIKMVGEKGSIAYTSVLNANAYGARGTYRMKGTHYYEMREGRWIAVNK